MTTPREETHYDALGVGDDADYATIRRAYVSLMRKHHPDVAGPAGASATTRITAAWHVLQDSARRAEYDRGLRQESVDPGSEEPAEFADEWGQEADWAPTADDDEVEEAEVEDEVPSPSPQPPPPSKPPNAFPPPERREAPTAEQEPTVTVEHPTRRLPQIAAALTAALTATVLTVAMCGISAFDLTGSAALAPAVVFALIGVAVGGYFRSIAKGVYRDLFVYGAALILLVGGVEFADLGQVRGPLRLLYPLLAGIAVGDVVGTMLAAQRRLDRLIPVKNLRRNNMFGTLPGGVEADLVETACGPLYSFPGTRIVHSPNETALFTHFLICGSKVALVRGLVAPSGSFRWSGPSLLLDTATMPTQVLTADYPGFLAQVQKTLPETVTISSWIAVRTLDNGPAHGPAATVDPTASTAPQVVDMTILGARLSDFLTDDNDTSLVNQETVYQSLLLAVSD